MKKYIKFGITLSVLAVAAVLVILKYYDYIYNPWTRDGQVAAQIIQVTPRVSGQVVKMEVKDNQLVKAGDLLFKIDNSVYLAELEKAEAALADAGNNLKVLDLQVEAARARVELNIEGEKQAARGLAEARVRLEGSKSVYERKMLLLKNNVTARKELEDAEASYAEAVANYNSAEAKLAGVKASLLEAKATLEKEAANRGGAGGDNSLLQRAKSEVKLAQLNLGFTEVQAPVDGYVINLNIHQGTQAVANLPALAIVQTGTFWVYGFFREDCIQDISAGDKAVVTLMSYAATPLQGIVESVGWGIAQKDGSAGYNLLPTINPTFEWIRLAQRVPVKIHLLNLPDHIKLRVGTTASIIIKTAKQQK